MKRKKKNFYIIEIMVMKWKSEFLIAELKNELHKHANTHGSKQIGFIREEESTQLSA